MFPVKSVGNWSGRVIKINKMGIKINKMGTGYVFTYF
jgi:hypothetical protein